MKKIIYLFPIFVLLFSFCSENHPELLIETLTISADKESIVADEEEVITFSVKSQNGRDLTKEAKIVVNGTELSGNTFKTDEAGTFTCYASVDEISSNELTFTATPKQASLILTADRKSILADGSDHLTFIVRDAQGKDVSASAKIKVNDKDISGQTYKTTESGAHSAVAFVGKEFSLPLHFTANRVEEVILSADKTLVYLDDDAKIVLTAKNTEGKDLTPECAFFVGDTPIESNVYHPQMVGRLSFSAIYNDNKSTIISVTVREPIRYNLIIRPSKDILIGDNVDEVSFSCINTAENNEDLTSETTFFVDKQPLSGRTFKTTEIGTHTITARYKDHEATPFFLIVEPHPDTIAKTLTLSADKENIFADGEDFVTFSVKNQAGRDFTDKVTIQINDKAIDGHTFKTSTPNIYKVVAVVANVKSNVIAINAIKRPAQLKVQVSKTNIIADGKDEITLTCINTADKNKDVTSETTFYVDEQPITGNKFRTNATGDHRITAQYDGYTSPAVIVVASPHPDTTVQSLTLSADKNEIFADGEQFVTFSVKNQANRDFTGQATIQINDASIEGHTFKTLIPGSYKVVASVGSEKSNIITINAIKRPAQLKIQTSKTNVIADGKDAVVLSCINIADKNKDVTPETTFFANGQAISGNRFKTKTVGDYRITARYDGYESLPVLVVATPHPDDIATSLTISASKKSIIANNKDVVTFTVKNQANKDFTSQATIFVENKAITGHSFKTSKPNAYKIYAKVGEVRSNTISLQATPRPASLKLTLSPRSILANGRETVTFTVRDANDNDISGLATFMVNGQRVTTRAYTTSVAGTYNVIARYEEEHSNQEAFTAHRVERITIEADQSQLTLGSTVHFTIRDSSQADVSTSSQIFVNDRRIPSYFYTPSHTGTFSAYAVYNGNRSETITFRVDQPIRQDLAVQTDKSTIVSDGADFAVLKCIDTSSGGRDVTASVTFYADGIRLPSNILRSTKNGAISIVAKTDGQESRPLNVTGQVDLAAVPRLYVEEFTATWCPQCPRAIHMIDEASKDDKVVAVAFHGYPDPFFTHATRTVGDALNVTGYPSIVANRDTYQHILTSGNPTNITSRIPRSTTVGIAVETQLTGRTLSGTINVRSSRTERKARWIAIITEDNLIADQKNSTGFFPHIGDGFSHSHVYRGAIGGVNDGTVFDLPKDNTQKIPVSINIDPKFVPQNCKLVVLILGSDGKVLNVQRVKLGGSISY